MTLITRRWFLTVAFALACATMPAGAAAQSADVIADDATRYLALGDSIAAGYKATPVTKGYAYLLYQRGVFDEIDHTLFANAAIPGASSRDLLLHQVPQALIAAGDGGFIPDRITVTIGGNDLLSILHFMRTHADQGEVLQFATGVLGTYGQNLYASLYSLRQGRPNARIYVGNQYGNPTVEAIVPLAAPLIAAFNDTVRQVVEQFATNVYLVDVHSAFLGGDDLLLNELPGVSPFETHLTDSGHKAMARAFAAVIDQTR
jgi:lysophospholipase L1-like esterase